MTLKLPPGVHLGKPEPGEEEEVISDSSWAHPPQPAGMGSSGLQELETAGQTVKLPPTGGKRADKR